MAGKWWRCLREEITDLEDLEENVNEELTNAEPAIGVKFETAEKAFIFITLWNPRWGKWRIVSDEGHGPYNLLMCMIPWGQHQNRKGE